MADRRRVVEGTHHAFVLRSASGWRRTGLDIPRSRETGVVDAAAIANCRLRDRRASIPHSALRIPHYVFRAPLPLRLLVSRRRLPPRAAGARRVAARLPRA